MNREGDAKNFEQSKAGVSQDSENLLNEEKIKLAKEATKKGKPVEEIADILDLPLTFVQELARSQTAEIKKETTGTA